jgi:hypothetical protein
MLHFAEWAVLGGIEFELEMNDAAKPLIGRVGNEAAP